MRSLYRPGQAKCVTDEMKKYGIDVLAMQEVRWPNNGECVTNGYTILYSGREDGRHNQGVGICMNAKAKKSLINFEPINERLMRVRLNSRWFKITIIVAYAPTNDSDDEEKDEFYDQLNRCTEEVQNHDILVMAGDMNAKVGRETDVFGSAIGSKSLHEESNDNGVRMASYACMNNMVIGGTIFPHKNIHKRTWTTPDGRSHNQIDHILIKQRFRRSLQDVRSYRGADCDSDHYLVVANIKVKLKMERTPRTEKVRRFNVDKLKTQDIRNEFQIKIQNRFSTLDILEENEEEIAVEEEWREIQSTIKEVAEEVLGFEERINSTDWYDAECRSVCSERKEMRILYLQNPDSIQMSENFRAKTREAKRIIRQKKRQHLNSNIDTIENERREGNIREMYNKVNNIKNGFQARTKMIKSTDGTVLITEQKVIERWENYFRELLNRAEPEEPLEGQEYQRAEVEDVIPTLEEVRKAMKSMKNSKAPGEDNLTAELFKSGGECLERKMTRLVQKIWRNERIPQSWSVGIIIPLHKKGDKSLCSNYRGICLLEIGYKIFAKVLYNRLVTLSEEIIGDYQCGFRKKRATTDHIFTIRQIMEKYWEYNKDLYQLFIDFKQAYDSIHRPSVWSILLEFGIPMKLIRLIKLCLSDTKAKVKVGGKTSEAFEIKSGLRQGCVLSVLLFNFVMEKVTKVIENGEGAKLNGQNINNLTYADDVDLIAESREDILRLVMPFQEVANKVGLQINFGKTKILKMSREGGDGSLVINDKEIEEVEEFKYLGTTVTNKNDMKTEILIRITAANRCYFSLISIMKKRSVSKKTKLRLYNTIIRPVVLYACETWSMTKEIEHRLMVFENTILRRIAGPIFDREENIWRRRHNAELREYTSQEKIVDVIKRMKLRWAGHVARMNEDRLPKRAMLGVVDGHRPRGRPRRRWIDGVRAAFMERGGGEDWFIAAQNRDEWRGMLLADMGQHVAQDPAE